MENKTQGEMKKDSLKDTNPYSECGSSRVIIIVFLALLIDLLGFTLILPLFPSILDHYGKTDDGFYQSLQSTVDWFADMVGVPHERKYNSVLFGGLIGSIFSLLQFVSSPLTGAASDYFGRRQLMIMTMVGLIVSYGLWAVSRSFGVFLLSRVVGGISKANVSLSTAIIADLHSQEARSKGMAMIGVAFSLGFTVGPMIGAYFAMTTTKGTFYLCPAILALMFALADLMFISLFLPETLPKEKRVTTVSSGFQEATDLLSPLALFQFTAVTRTKDSLSKEGVQNLKILGLVYFLYLFLFSGLEYTLSFLTHQRFHFNSMQQGKMFFFIGIAMAVIQGGYARRIHPGSEIRAVKMALILLIPAFILIGWARNVTMLYFGLLLYSFAAAIVVPCLSTMVSAYVYWLAGAEVCFVACSTFFLLPLVLLGTMKQIKAD
ncbi:major facilitator superfamily domain-containing protein 10 isoform X1 [Latimeria chalumnae]|uniref:major facilitator superfamily domain-containing protein 10 isoform X1 n=1 Tax=Latimeria chalumnae TaxID=7897 RepID=UPI0003C169D3|nr:PREDICTED: major facilitator superfamily domain-containing protein 10 isoform X2 [Latimeria chalumnae]|eukprot:XP_005998244.1 PREDICTED: major facilitator superfamily domain-containing protein 10 isoform X2 [Latimeria chalumnae]